MHSSWAEITSPLVTYLVIFNEFCNLPPFYSKFHEVVQLYLLFNRRYLTRCAILRYDAHNKLKMELNFLKVCFNEEFLFHFLFAGYARGALLKSPQNSVSCSFGMRSSKMTNVTAGREAGNNRPPLIRWRASDQLTAKLCPPQRELMATNTILINWCKKVTRSRVKWNQSILEHCHLKDPNIVTPRVAPMNLIKKSLGKS